MNPNGCRLSIECYNVDWNAMHRYFLSQDESCHWYIVRDDKRSEWEDWNNDPDDGFPPATIAYSVGGWPGQITFEKPACWNEEIEID
jgi:hypothetical protein